MSVCCFCPLTEKEKKSKVQINGALIESSDGAMWYSYRISVWHRLKWLYRASVTAGWCTRPIHSVNFLYSIAVFTHTLQLWNVLDISLQSYMWKKKLLNLGNYNHIIRKFPSLFLSEECSLLRSLSDWFIHKASPTQVWATTSESLSKLLLCSKVTLFAETFSVVKNLWYRQMAWVSVSSAAYCLSAQ